MQKNTGKAPSIQFYYKDFLADMAEHNPEIVGAWILVLCKIWHVNNCGEITKTLDQLAKIMHSDSSAAQKFIDYFSSENIATVTECNGKITVVNRRSKRDAKLKQQNALRQKRFRGKQQSNGDVAPEKVNPSTSSSSSTSVNTHTFSMENVESAAMLIGIDPEKAKLFYHHFNAQGWVRANGQKIVNLGSALVYWRNNEFRFEKGKTHGRKTIPDQSRADQETTEPNRGEVPIGPRPDGVFLR